MQASMLTPAQREAAGAVFVLALRHVQEDQSRRSFCNEVSEKTPVGDFDGDPKSAMPGESISWTHPKSGVFRSVFRFLQVDEKSLAKLEETAPLSPVEDQIGLFFKILSEDAKETSSEIREQELALSKAVDAMEINFETPASSQFNKENQEKYERDCRERTPVVEAPPIPDLTDESAEITQLTDSKMLVNMEVALNDPGCSCDQRSISAELPISNQRKMTLLFELISACIADIPENDEKKSPMTKGYDARHRAALRLLATWLDVKWKKVVAMEIIVACSAMKVVQEKKSQTEEIDSRQSKWAKLKRGGIIGAAALTGGTLLAITGGLAAPAIAAGFGALAPTLGTLVPVIGASGFAAAAGAAGSAAGSVAVAASFGAAGAGLSGTKMARRIGEIDEFEFVPIGNNHSQGHLSVGILISGFVCEKEDFTRPWEGCNEKLEKYALQWESKYLYAVSTAIRDWIASRVTMELMRQGAMLTVLSSLVTALAWPAALLSATNYIDSEWTMALDRSDKAGKLLAEEVLLKGLQGGRPVTLFGFSLGARVIFNCLLHLAEKGDNAGLVEQVVLLGSPIPLKREQWEMARKVVAGRFVNVFATNDWTLGIAFRASLLTQGLGGIQPVDVPGIENVDVTNFIEGHSSYLWKTQQILDKLDMDAYFPAPLSFPNKNQ